MSTKMPPVPEDQRSHKGPGADPATAAAKQTGGSPGAVPSNADQQGHQGNSKQNTTNQGYQQDR